MRFLLAPHKPAHPNFDPISKALRELYAARPKERVPQEWLDMIRDLK